MLIRSFLIQASKAISVVHCSFGSLVFPTTDITSDLNLQRMNRPSIIYPFRGRNNGLQDNSEIITRGLNSFVSLKPGFHIIAPMAPIARNSVRAIHCFHMIARKFYSIVPIARIEQSSIWAITIVPQLSVTVSI